MRKRELIHITSFERNHHFYPPLHLLLTVKSFNLQEIRRRYLLSRKHSSGRTGSIQRRKPKTGGIISATLKSGRMHAKVLVEITEPRGIAVRGGRVCIAAENKVFSITEQVQKLGNPWFSYIHGLDISEDEKLLLSSSGLDMVFEYDLRSMEKTFEWSAWEHGFNKGFDPQKGCAVYLTRDSEEYTRLKRSGKHALLIRDPLKDHLPTANRSAFINSVHYNPADEMRFAATFFHEGSVYEIDKTGGTARLMLKNLSNPHGGRKLGGMWMAVSTAAGELIAGDTIYSTSGLPGKAKEMKNTEWLQNATAIDDCFVIIDSNRNAFILLDPVKQMYDIIPYNRKWAVQDLVAYCPHIISTDRISALKD